jgi:N-methylhydantoinase B
VQLKRGDLVSIRTGGGGGWGDPLERDPELVLWDVVNEYITPETAREVYGVVVDPEKRQIDWEATRKLREQMKNQKRKCPEGVPGP